MTHVVAVLIVLGCVGVEIAVSSNGVKKGGVTLALALKEREEEATGRKRDFERRPAEERKRLTVREEAAIERRD